MQILSFFAADESRHKSKQVLTLYGVGFWPSPAIRGTMPLDRVGMDGP